MKRNSTKLEVWHLINDPNPRRGGAQKILEKLSNDKEEIISKTTAPYPFFNFFPNIILSILCISVRITRKAPILAYIHSRCFLPLSLLLKAAGSKTVFYAHADYRRYLWAYKLFPCDHYIAVSESVRYSLLKHGIKTDKISTISNPYIGEGHVLPIPVEGAILKIGFVGSLNSWKGIIEGIEAIYAISAELKDRLVLQIVGDGPLMEQVIELGRKAPQNIDIIISGYQDEPFKALRDSQILLIPSLEEGFGLVAIEGIYQGKIVLYNSIPALQEICKNDSLSYSFNINNRPSLLSAISHIYNSLHALSNTTFIRHRSECIKKKYGLEQFTKEHQMLKEKLLAKLTTIK